MCSLRDAKAISGTLKQGKSVGYGLYILAWYLLEILAYSGIRIAI